jgi:hypothetical protein
MGVAMRCLGRLACLSVISTGCLLAAGDGTMAGAWTRAKGDGLVITTTTRRMAPVGALFSGVADRDANISQIYVEYGLLEGLTIGGKMYVELSTSDTTRSSAALGGFVRKQVWHDQSGGVASVEAGYAHPIDSLLGRAFSYADPGSVPEAYLAGLYGRSWYGDWGNAFLSTGAAYHWRGEGLADELRFEVTSGYAPWRRVSGMVNLFGLTPLAGGTEDSLKIGASVAYTLWPFVARNEKKPRGRINPETVQLGASYDLLNPDDGLGLSISIWRPF